MQPAVSVLERVDIDKAECENRRRHDRIELLRGLPVESDHALYESGQMFRSGADMAWYGHARFAVPFADETALVPQTETDEPGIADHDALQAQQFVEIDRLPAGLADGAAPPLDAVLRRMFTLDGETGPGVFQQQEGRRARQEVARDCCNGILRARAQVHGDEALQRLGAEHQRTEFRRTGQVVLYPVP